MGAKFADVSDPTDAFPMEGSAPSFGVQPATETQPRRLIKSARDDWERKRLKMTNDPSNKAPPLTDIKYDAEKLQAESQLFIDKFKARMKDIAEETLGELYVNIMPYSETDTWTNYREALRLELEHEYKYSSFKNEWATNFRRAVFVENREEIAKLIEQDILKRIKFLEDCRQEYEAFRYTPLGDTYQCLKRENAELREALAEIIEDADYLKEHPGSTDKAYAWVKKRIEAALNKTKAGGGT